MNVRIARNGVEIGECDREDLEQLVREEQLLPTDHYWHEGMEDWKPVQDLVQAATPSSPAPASAVEGSSNQTQLPDTVPAVAPGGETADPWNKSSPPPPLFRSRRTTMVTITCLAAAVVGFCLYVVIGFSTRRPEMPSPIVEPTTNIERTNTALRTRATDELTARLSKLPAVAVPPTNTFYSDVSIAIPDAPAPLTVRIRGSESVVDPATRQITSHTNFMLRADFRQERWFFKDYHASINDLVHGTTTEMERDDQDLVPPAIVSLLGIQLKSR